MDRNEVVCPLLHLSQLPENDQEHFPAEPFQPAVEFPDPDHPRAPVIRIAGNQLPDAFQGVGELKSANEVAGPKLILSDYYKTTFKMEDRAIERLTDLNDFWMPYVTDDSVFPIDCVYTKDELDTIDMYKTDFQNTVAEYEGKWLKDGGPSDDEWEAYKSALTNSCGAEELLQVYKDAYARYQEASN